MGRTNINKTKSKNRIKQKIKRTSKKILIK